MTISKAKQLYCYNKELDDLSKRCFTPQCSSPASRLKPSYTSTGLQQTLPLSTLTPPLHDGRGMAEPGKELEAGLGDDRVEENAAQSHSLCCHGEDGLQLGVLSWVNH